MNTIRSERLTESVAYHGEGPVWSESWGGLRWVDMLAGDLLSLAADGAIGRRHIGAVAACVRPRRSGGAVIGIERGFALEDRDGQVTPLGDLWSDETVRMNEGGCDPDGRFYCGSMAYDERPGAAALHRLDPDGSTHLILEGLTISNGLDWSPEGDRAYYVDSSTHSIDSFDYETEAGLVRRRPFVEIAPGLGDPDGLTVDGEGGVWVALWGGGAVHRYRPDGDLDLVVEVGARQVTACALGGPELDRLFITTSREGLEPGEDPLAGSLFTVEAGVRGQPVREFAG